MYLEKIEITGFKSFADKTVLKFNQPITAIVGPNGCGKSNIVDAFRWVLGEGSAKSLRSDKMVDVIFSGSVKRKPLNYAQISLTFSQIKKTLSLGFDELCITRRVHRSGESEWYINKNTARLKDVYKILWEAGMGKNAFYIFEQGKVDELITSSPLERRCIFEEAAKIMHFKEKKKESLRKLKQVEENLGRVLDIQKEVEGHIQRLEKQAEEAERYTEKKNQLEALEKGLLIYKAHHYEKKWVTKQEQSNQNEEEQKKVKEDIQILRASLTKNKEAVFFLQSKTKSAHEAFFEVKKSKELAEYEKNTHQRKIAEHQKNLDRLKQSLLSSHQKHLQEQHSFEENQKKLHVERKELSSISQSLGEINQSLTHLESTVEKQSDERKLAQEKLMVLVSSANEAKSEYRKNQTQLHHQKDRLASYLHQKEHSSKEKTNLDNQLHELNQLLEEIEKSYAENQKLLEKIETQVTSDELKSNDLNEQVIELKSKVSSLKASSGTLQRLKNEFEGYNQSSKKLLKFAASSQHSLFEKITPLTDWIQAKPGYEDQVTTLLQPYLQTLVVQTKEDLALVFEVAEKEKLYQFSCICVDELSKNASSTLSLAESNPLSNHFLGASSEEAKHAFSKPGYYLDPRGVYHRISKSAQTVFTRANELTKQLSELKECEKALLEKTDLLNKTKEQLNKIKTQLQSAKSKERELSNQLNQSQYKKQSTERQLVKLSEQSTGFDEPIQELQSSIQALEEAQKSYIQKCQEEEEKEQAQKTLFSEVEKNFEKHFSTLKEKRSLKQSLEDKMKQREKSAQTLKEEIRIFESQAKDFETKIEELNAAIESQEQQNQELLELEKELIEKASSFDESLEKSKNRYQELEDKLKNIEESQKEEEKTSQDLEEKRELLQKAEIEIKTSLSELQTQKEMLKEELDDKLSLSLKEALEEPIDPAITLGQTEKEIRRLRRALQEQPEVNLKALSECQEEKARFEFLQSQVDDLNLSQEKLVEIITELDESSRLKFQETFEKIRGHFRENFALLFNGGEADLKLADHADILEAGIDIIAQPPGKKMRSIQLMSGGEKCLCAIALLFALFETQSIPFCILDEIDAPLDDTNIERFTRVLKQFVEKHQFIIITHNKRTMAICDKLLGVSMQERGVTKIIPFEFSDKRAEAAITN